MDNIFSSSVSLLTLDQSIVFTANSDEFISDVQVINRSKPLKITLVWTDAPAMVNSNPALVNDLDLIVSKCGETYYGNNMENSFSLSGGTRDNINNIENVFIENPLGIYRITVRATNLMGDGIPGNTEPIDQDFALIISNGTSDLEPMFQGPRPQCIQNPPTPYLPESSFENTE